jgi:ABC-type oligopeptide transport system ATPase subunit
MTMRYNIVQRKAVEVIKKYEKIQEEEIRQNNTISFDDSYSELVEIKLDRFSRLNLDIYFWIMSRDEEKRKYKADDRGFFSSIW